MELHRFVAGAGADAALHVTPYYNKPSAEGLYRHFMAVADAADLPVVLYNIPGRAGVGLDLETIVRLAEHPNIVAIKDATGGLEMTARVKAATTLTILSGDDPLTLPLATVLERFGRRSLCWANRPAWSRRRRCAARSIKTGDWDQARWRFTSSSLPTAQALLSLDYESRSRSSPPWRIHGTGLGSRSACAV